ncbi:MAG: hypothetical protein APF76_02215 [Desulfitibacter sp. BRH_c19]|nr:MAG: hypothetical protein APF76_02215 [Desulfitibacter sp. BRH_c19]
MDFQFPLQKLLNYKENIEEKKKEKLAHVQDKRRILEEELLVTQRRHKLCTINTPAKKVNILMFGHQLAYMEYLDGIIDEQASAVKEASFTVDKCRVEVVEASRDRKVIEKLKGKQENIYYKEMDRKELMELNEMALNKFFEENKKN